MTNSLRNFALWMIGVLMLFNVSHFCRLNRSKGL
jgi:hypothetical protein